MYFSIEDLPEFVIRQDSENNFNITHYFGESSSDKTYNNLETNKIKGVFFVFLFLVKQLLLIKMDTVNKNMKINIMLI